MVQEALSKVTKHLEELKEMQKKADKEPSTNDSGTSPVGTQIGTKGYQGPQQRQFNRNQPTQNYKQVYSNRQPSMPYQSRNFQGRRPPYNPMAPHTQNYGGVICFKCRQPGHIAPKCTAPVVMGHLQMMAGGSQPLTHDQAGTVPMDQDGNSWSMNSATSSTGQGMQAAPAQSPAQGLSVNRPHNLRNQGNSPGTSH